tara:strand:+ start:324 stop:542 length:219 start_codon:yes stop_codon:yes gene_type:complete
MLIWRKGEPMEKSLKMIDNDKEEQSKKIAKREKVITRNLNPFISNNDYINNISVQDKFLRPLDSNVQVAAQK